MQKRWVLKSKKNVEKFNTLKQQLGINPIIIELLLNRGIETFEQAREFFRPSLAYLHDPFLMKDMDKAISRIEKAILEKQKILIYGDYDVDGTTAVSVVYSFLRNYHSEIEYYIPDRYKEGYGISTEGIDYAYENGFKLIIALDCGIKAVEKISYANSKNIDFIIGDHHLPGETLPEAIAVLDPKRPDCPYPYKELSGCGIGFKIIQAFIEQNKMDPELAFQYLDLVAVSIASDIVPNTGENRILTHFGLIKLGNNPGFGLKALISLSNHKSEEFSLSDVVFQIGPLINAAGRIDHAKDAVQLLVSKSYPEAIEFAKKIEEQNKIRKDFDLQITQEALGILENDPRLHTKKTTVLYKPDWNKGVIGIVASRLIERYYRPTIVLTQTNGHIAGSARSVSDFDLYEALSECSDLLDQFGGHKYAAGLTMQKSNLIEFQARFEEIVSRKIKPQMLQKEIIIEDKISLKDIDSKFIRLLVQFKPFGPENEAPIFTSEEVTMPIPARIVGANHLKLKVRQSDSASFDCIGFNLGEYAESLNSGKPFKICYTIEENNWNGRKSLQLNVKEIKF